MWRKMEQKEQNNKSTNQISLKKNVLFDLKITDLFFNSKIADL